VAGVYDMAGRLTSQTGAALTSRNAGQGSILVRPAVHSRSRRVAAVHGEDAGKTQGRSALAP
jgi:hypothetical protein